MWDEVHCGAGVHLEEKEEETGKQAMFKMSEKLPFMLRAMIQKSTLLSYSLLRNGQTLFG